MLHLYTNETPDNRPFAVVTNKYASIYQSNICLSVYLYFRQYIFLKLLQTSSPCCYSAQINKLLIDNHNLISFLLKQCDVNRDINLHEILIFKIYLFSGIASIEITMSNKAKMCNLIISHALLLYVSLSIWNAFLRNFSSNYYICVFCHSSKVNSFPAFKLGLDGLFLKAHSYKPLFKPLTHYSALI